MTRARGNGFATKRDLAAVRTTRVVGRRTVVLPAVPSTNRHATGICR